MSELLSIKIEDKNFRFHSRKQLIEWWDEERTKWQWLWDGGRREFNHLRNIEGGLTKLVATESADRISAELSKFFDRAKMGVPHSGSADGQRYLKAAALTEPDDVRSLMVVEQSQQGKQNLQNITWVYQFVRGAAASFAGLGGDRAEMAAERRSYKHAIDRLEQRVRDLEGEKDEFIRRRARRIKTLSRRLMRRSATIWYQAAEEFETKRDTVVQTIIETEDKYRKQMALKAPVEYWQTKAASHGKWEIGWAVAMVIYFVAAAFAIYKIAIGAAEYLLTVPDSTHATPVYIIVSGATLGATTLIFWIGRLLAKLFLSEHHLGADSREKAVMTQAFLSMETRESFSNEERAIILASIFRSSPDGIVKDDGPPDMAASSAIARIMSGR
jgi:hypothetical protein